MQNNLKSTLLSFMYTAAHILNISTYIIWIHSFLI